MTVIHRSPRWRARLLGNRQWFFVVALAFAATFARTDSARAIDLANSVNQWSAAGNQGENDWFYGYRNFTTDGGGAYDYLNHFIPFNNDGTNVISPTNQWAGNHWRLEGNPGGTGGPWTELFQENTHPNGTNSQPLQEHWTIRRWVANSLADPTELALEWHMRKTNTGGGNGVGGFLFLNGVQLDTATIAGNDGVGVLRTAVTVINPGDVIDLALTPNGNDGADGSAFRLRVTDELPPPPPAPPIADSLADWSTTGTQGERNWFNGYFKYTGDANGQYDVDDFIAFNNDGTNAVNPDGANHWDGSQFRLYRVAGPWTSLGSEGTHPNGTNSALPVGPPEEHWTVRRWVADVTETTPLALNWLMRKTNPNGTGVEGKLFVNGVEVDGTAIAGNDSTGVNRKYYANISPGDIIELALGPTGPTGDRTDGSDGSANRLIIDPNIPAGARQPATIKLADSVTGWSTTGTQGQNNWFYGYYDVRADAVTNGGDGQYGAEELTLFLNDGSNVIANSTATWSSSPNHWSGSSWDLAANVAPWTAVSATNGHPAATVNSTTNPIHWAVRRWVSDVEGEVEIMGTVQRPSASGDGTIGRLFVDGVEVWSGLTNANQAVNFSVLANVTNGSVIDLAIDADGGNVYNELTGAGLNSINDGSDTTNFSFMVFRAGEVFVPVPEPSSVALMLLGAAGLGSVAYRRRR